MSSRRQRFSPETYLTGILAGDRVLLSRAITIIESQLPSDRQLAHQLIEACLPKSGQSIRIGITGVPGVGKSTFIDAFGMYLIGQGKKVAVLAVDPSSHISQGSILGDKTRMNRLSYAPEAFIRPSPTAGSLGGVSRATQETAILCEAAGYDLLLIETVGVGQSEIAVHGMVDFFLLLALPNAGDELQGIKKGIMEMAHGIFINKSEGEQAALARLAKQKMGQALRMFPPDHTGWRAEVLLGSALVETGLDKCWQLIQQYQQHLQQANQWEAMRQRQLGHWLQESLRHQLETAFFTHPDIQSRLPELRQAVESREISPSHAAESLLQLWMKTL